MATSSLWKPAFICRSCRTRLSSTPTVRPFSLSASQARPDDRAPGFADIISPRTAKARPQPNGTSPLNPPPAAGSASPETTATASGKGDGGDAAAAGRTPRTAIEQLDDALGDRGAAQPAPANDSRALFSELRKATRASSKYPGLSPAERHARHAADQESRRQLAQRKRDIESFATRVWRDGDVYAPHDLSAAAMRKGRTMRSRRVAESLPLNSRRGGGRDVLDDLGINPVKEYKNFALINDLVTDLGRIKHSRVTGFRAVNQRRASKAVRRAHGMGLLPTTHRHPELFPEQVALRTGLGFGRF